MVLREAFAAVAGLNTNAIFLAKFGREGKGRTDAGGLVQDVRGRLLEAASLLDELSREQRTLQDRFSTLAKRHG
jgi:hypothetical protein